MKGLELIFGVAIGYIAFTENGHAIGDKMADIAVKQLKNTVSGGAKLLKNNTKQDNAAKNGENNQTEA